MDKLNKLKRFAKIKDNPELAIPQEFDRVDNVIEGLKETDQSIAESVRQLSTEISNDIKNVVDNLTQKIDTIELQKGDKGDSIKGEDGKDGKDGVDGKDGRDGRDGIDGLNGKDGVDGKDGLNAIVDYEKVTQETLTRVGEVKDSPEEIRNKLELLQGNERLDKSAIRGLEEAIKDIKHVSTINHSGVSTETVLRLIAENDSGYDTTTFAKLDGTNQPFTGDIEISKTTPELKLTDTEYTRLTRVAASNEAHLYNRVAVLGGDGTGGTITYNAGKTIHTFTTVGANTFVPPAGLTSVEVLVIAGGGGGATLGGGGGAGGVVYHSNKTISGPISITVGDGGAGATAPAPFVRGTNGQDSTFADITALGGGGGASQTISNSLDGGSTGGVMSGTPSAIVQGNSGGGIGYGYAGGLGVPAGAASGGGGGGSGQVGSASAGLVGGKGGDGMANPIAGSTVGVLNSGTYYIAGGGGGGSQGGTGGAGGKGGGGTGSGGNTATAGTDGTGSGGGSSGYAGAYGTAKKGGSGAVVVSYTPVATVIESNLIKSEDSLVGGISGVTTFGDNASDTIIDGNTIKLNIGGTTKVTLNNSGNLGIGITPTSVLTLKAGSATAGTAPLKLTSGTLNTTAEVGAVEFLTDKLYGTITTGAARKEITLNDAALTSGKYPKITTNGRLTDGPTPLVGTKVYYVSDTSGGAVTRKLTFIDGILTSET